MAEQTSPPTLPPGALIFCPDCDAQRSPLIAENDARAWTCFAGCAGPSS